MQFFRIAELVERLETALRQDKLSAFRKLFDKVDLFILDEMRYLPFVQEGSELLFPNRLHLHMIRHTKTMHLLEAGVNLIYIRDLLGHVNVTTTEIYLRANTETKRKALESADIEGVSQDVPV